jgi:hypothetical protein
MEESEDAPLLHTADLMHELLRVAAVGPADVDDALSRLRADLRAAGEPLALPERTLRERLEQARRHLRAARLIAPVGRTRFEATERGQTVLRDYPGGIDDSVLMQFPEFRDFIAQAAGTPPHPARQTAYDLGYAAYGQGSAPADNPYSVDSDDHLAWENGWFEARDEDLLRRD